MRVTFEVATFTMIPSEGHAYMERMGCPKHGDDVVFEMHTDEQVMVCSSCMDEAETAAYDAMMAAARAAKGMRDALS